MKFSLLTLVAFFGVVGALKRPSLSISVQDGSFDGVEGLDPVLSWESSNAVGDVDLSYGVEASVRPTTDIASLPRKVWGKASTEVSGWGVSARADIDAQNLESTDLEVDAKNDELDLSMNLLASVGSDSSVQSVKATKGFEANGGRITVTPRFGIADDTKDVVVNYSNDKTEVELTASLDSQEVMVSQRIDDDNRIAPTISSTGDISVEWERSTGDDSSVTTTLKPNNSLDVEWKDAAWTANVNMPIDGTSINGANVSIKRDVTF